MGIAEVAVAILLLDQREERALLDDAPLAHHADRDVAAAVEGVDRVDERRGLLVVDADRDGQQLAMPRATASAWIIPRASTSSQSPQISVSYTSPGTSDSIHRERGHEDGSHQRGAKHRIENEHADPRQSRASGRQDAAYLDSRYYTRECSGQATVRSRNSYDAWLSVTKVDGATASRRRHWPLAFWFFLPYGDRIEWWIVGFSEQTKELLMSRDSETANRTEGVDRRSLLKGTASAAILGISGLGTGLRAAEPAEGGVAVKNGRIQQSIVHWCFEQYWPIDEFIKTARSLGINSIELLPVKYFPQLKEAGMTNAIGQIDMGARPAVRERL